MLVFGSIPAFPEDSELSDSGNYGKQTRVEANTRGSSQHPARCSIFLGLHWGLNHNGGGR